MSLGSRLILAIEEPPSRRKPSSPSTTSEIVAFRTSSSVNVSSKKRRNGPIAQLAFWSFALPSSSAERPSKSRRLTSLASVAPTIAPLEATASAISGSGLFQREALWKPASSPVPTADIGWLLVNTSTSGPMPTSRYCDQAPALTSASLSRIAADEPGLRVLRSSPRTRTISSRALRRAFAAAARALFDHALEQRLRERDASSLDRLQIDGREQTRVHRGAAVARGVGENVAERADARTLRRIAAPGQARAPRRDRASSGTPR